MTKKFYTAEEVAAIFLVTTWTIREWCKQGKFKGATKPGRGWRIPEEAVREVAESRHG